MKIKLLLLAVFVFGSMQAQKYTNTNSSVVTKEWKGFTFTSEKSLFLNIEDAEPFSMAAPLFEQGVIAEDAMLTAFVMVNNSFSTLDEEQEKALFGAASKPYVSYHLIPGRVDSHALETAVDNGDGTAYFSTVLGQRLGVKRNASGDLMLFDTNGNTAKLLATDFYHKNGFFHIIDGLILPSNNE
ncbi:MAG: fasciclin domain-containing protein [Marinirhabdus sp.]|nr:fasciclin domain-containing protein [Marinirhabdus sp.]